MAVGRALRAAGCRLWNWRYEAYLLYLLLRLTRGPWLELAFNRFEALKQRPKKDTAFILGSGYSINAISPDHWQRLRAQGDTLSFNYFFKGRFTDMDYHVMREVTGYRGLASPKTYRALRSYTGELQSNPCYRQTDFFLLFDQKSPNTSLALLKNLLPSERITLYSNRLDRYASFPPSETNRGIPHCVATLFDSMNLAYALGYHRIVLVGVDLYDRRYFWLDEDEIRSNDAARGAKVTDPHNTAGSVLTNIRPWDEFFQARGRELYVLNPRSLLADFLPVYSL